MDPIQNQPAQQVPPQAATQTSGAPLEPMTPHKKVGPIVAILVVVLILIIGALYIFASRMNQTPIDNTNAETAMIETTVKPVTNTSDDVSSIEADLNASVDGLDAQNF